MSIDVHSKPNSLSRIALMAAIAIIALIGSYNWIIEPHLQCLHAAQKYAGHVDCLIQKTKLLQSKLKIKKIEFDKLSEITAVRQEQFFTAADAQQFVANLETLAKQNNCIMTSLNHLSNENSKSNAAYIPEFINSYSAAISLVGHFDDIVKFLAKLSARDEKIVINPFSLSNKSDSEKLECFLTLTIYVMNTAKRADPNGA